MHKCKKRFTNLKVTHPEESFGLQTIFLKFLLNRGPFCGATGIFGLQTMGIIGLP